MSLLALLATGTQPAIMTTPFERTGAATSLADEATFWSALASAHPAVEVATIGTSVRGQLIRTISIGRNPDNTILVGALVHPDEWYPREAVMALVRDLAVNHDGTWTDWLNDHRLIVIPAINPDGFPGSDVNANGLNLNRDYLALTQPETQAVATVITDHRPDVVIDLHGFWGGNQFEPYSSGFSAPTPAMRGIIEDLGTALVNALTTEGVQAVKKGSGNITTLRALAQLVHSVGLTTELLHALPAATQVPVQESALRHTLTWYAANAATIKAATAASRSESAAGTRSEPRLWTAGLLATPLPGLTGYALTGALPQAVIDIHNITVDNGFVSILQEAREAIPILLDPESAHSVAAATRMNSPA